MFITHCRHPIINVTTRREQAREASRKGVPTCRVVKLMKVARMEEDRAVS